MNELSIQTTFLGGEVGFSMSVQMEVLDAPIIEILEDGTMVEWIPCAVGVYMVVTEWTE